MSASRADGIPLLRCGLKPVEELGTMQVKREHQINFWYIIAAIMAVVMIQDLMTQSGHTRQIPYSEFQKLVAEKKVTDVVVGPTRISGTFTEPGQSDIKHFSTMRVP